MLPPPPPGDQSENKFLTPSSSVTYSRQHPPPQAVDLEEVILGALLIDKSALEIMPILFVDMFFLDRHQWIFESIQALYQEEQAIDLLTVAEKMKAMGTLVVSGGEYYLVQLTQKVASAAHIEHHVRIVMQKYVLRRMIEMGSMVISTSYEKDPDIFDIIDYVQGHITEVTDEITVGATEQSVSLAEALMEKREKLMKGELVTLPTGHYALDRHLGGGFPGSELTIVAARPGMGKTTFCLILTKQFSFVHKIPGVFFSIEMPRRQVVNKLIAEQVRIPYALIKNIRDMDNHQLSRLLQAYDWFEKESPLHVVDNISTIPGIYDYIKKHNPQYVIVDYLQLMGLDSSVSKKASNREQEVSYFSRNLKKIAKEFDIPVIALSQLNRKADERLGHRPKLSDLRESGALEQDADNVIFLIRDAYYRDAETVPPIEQGNTLIDFAKGRDHGVGVFYTNLEMVKLEMLENYQFGEDQSMLPPPPTSE